MQWKHSSSCDSSRNTLHQVAFDGHKEAAICLLDHGADINAKANVGDTPLIVVVQEGHLPLVELLVHRGADLNLANNQGDTSLLKAAQQGHLKVVKFLLERELWWISLLMMEAQPS